MVTCSAGDTKVARSIPGRCHFFLFLGKTVNFSMHSASEGTLSRWSSRPRALVGRVPCNLIYRLKIEITLLYFTYFTFYQMDQCWMSDLT